MMYVFNVAVLIESERKHYFSDLHKTRDLYLNICTRIYIENIQVNPFVF